MDNKKLYQKLYATLVGHVDSAISDLEDIASLESCDRQRILAVAESLQQTLLEAEEMYLDADDSE